MKKYLTLFSLLSMILLISTSIQSQESSKARLNHIALYVTNLSDSRIFYQEIIGLDTIPEPFHDGKHTWFSVGPQSHLHLIAGAESQPIHNKNSHLCFSVPSVPKFIKKLNQFNIDFENWAGEKGQVTNRVDGVLQIYFRDPDGYWIEINDAKE